MWEKHDQARPNFVSLGLHPHCFILNGAPGVELRLTWLYDGEVRAGRITLNRFVQLTATAPAKMFGLFPKKGTIAVGSDADIVLFDPNETHTISASTHHSLVDYWLFEGREVTGKVRRCFTGPVYCGGRSLARSARHGALSTACCPSPPRFPASLSPPKVGMLL